MRPRTAAVIGLRAIILAMVFAVLALVIFELDAGASKDLFVLPVLRFVDDVAGYQLQVTASAAAYQAASIIHQSLVTASTYFSTVKVFVFHHFGHLLPTLDTLGDATYVFLQTCRNIHDEVGKTLEVSAHLSRHGAEGS